MINEHAMISHEAVLERGLRDAISVLGDRLMPSAKVKEIHSFGRSEDNADVLFVWLVLDDGELCHFAFTPGQRVFVQTHGPLAAFESDADGEGE